MNICRATACCFTGHRPDKLPADEKPLRACLRQLIHAAAADGIRDFLCGMALGADRLATEEVLALKKSGAPVRLIAALPCPQQAARWSPADRQRYAQLLAQTDGQYVACEQYTPYCMNARNLWMVEHASRVIAVFDGSSGGTANTLRRAREQQLDILLIHPVTLAVTHEPTARRFE